MSDRFVMHASKEEVERLFEVSARRTDYFNSNYNITPGSLVSAVFLENGERNIHKFVWGLIPPDADNDRDGEENYEIPIESEEKPDWIKKSLEERRCIIPASGFYKWKTTKKKSTPFYIRLLSQPLVGFAGIYTIWKSQTGRDVYSCAQLTIKANALVQPVDDRMPIILHPDDYKTWLDPETEMDDLDRLLRPYSLTEMAVNRVSDDVNDADNNREELIQPIPK